jgi:hypothetical protein
VGTGYSEGGGRWHVTGGKWGNGYSEGMYRGVADMAIKRVCRNVMLLRESGEMNRLRVCKDITLLGEGRHGYSESR